MNTAMPCAGQHRAPPRRTAPAPASCANQYPGPGSGPAPLPVSAEPIGTRGAGAQPGREPRPSSARTGSIQGAVERVVDRQQPARAPAARAPGRRPQPPPPAHRRSPPRPGRSPPPPTPRPATSAAAAPGPRRRLGHRIIAPRPAAPHQPRPAAATSVHASSSDKHPGHVRRRDLPHAWPATASGVTPAACQHRGQRHHHRPQRRPARTSRPVQPGAPAAPARPPRDRDPSSTYGPAPPRLGQPPPRTPGEAAASSRPIPARWPP